MSEPMNRQERRASAANGRRMMKAGWSDFEQVHVSMSQFAALAKDAISVWKNNKYIVFVCREIETAWGPVGRLMVRQNDGEPVRSWADMQRIKNEFVSHEATAIQVFPPDAELHDAAPIYHLWILPDGFNLPFTLNDQGGQAR
jgi:hypothetical protein